nr:hypothetical protein OADCBASZ_OADCBASZ_CDS_0007 [Microvirus sp.]
MADSFSDKIKKQRAKQSFTEKLDYRPNPQPRLNPIESQSARVDRLLAGARMFDTYQAYLDSHYDKFDDELDYDDPSFDPDGFELSKHSEDYEAYQATKQKEIDELRAEENFQAEVKHKKRVKKALEADNDTTPPPPAE